MRAVSSDHTHAAFAAAAAQDGLVLESQSFDWLCEQGHVGLERVAKARRDPTIVAPVKAAIEALSAIYARLRGDESVLHASRENLLLPVDLVHIPTGTVIEVCGPPHFTSFRAATLDLYPSDAAIGFDLEVEKQLCREWSATTDGLSRGTTGQGFRFRRSPAPAGLPRCAARPGDPGDGPPAGDPDRGAGRGRRGRLPPPAGAAGRAQRCLSRGSP